MTELVSDLAAARHAAHLAFAALFPPPANGPRGDGTPAAFIRCVWDEITRRFNAAARSGEAAQISVMRNAEAVFRAIGDLDDQHYNALGAPERRAAAGVFGDGPWRDQEAAAVAAALASHPVLAAYEAERLQADADRAAAQLDMEQRRAALADCEAPAALLAALRGNGFSLGLTADGKHITLPPEHLAALEPDEGADLKKHKAAIVELLKAEAAAHRPVVAA